MLCSPSEGITRRRNQTKRRTLLFLTPHLTFVKNKGSGRYANSLLGFLMQLMKTTSKWNDAAWKSQCPLPPLLHFHLLDAVWTAGALNLLWTDKLQERGHNQRNAFIRQNADRYPFASSLVGLHSKGNVVNSTVGKVELIFFRWLQRLKAFCCPQETAGYFSSLK